MFWARTKSFKPLWSSSLKFEDFPEEPLKTSDGTILHAMERIYPMLVREQGFYTGRLVNADLVPCLYDNLIFFSIKLTRMERFLFILEEVARKNLSQYPLLYQAIKSIYKKIKSSWFILSSITPPSEDNNVPSMMGIFKTKSIKGGHIFSIEA